MSPSRFLWGARDSINGAGVKFTAGGFKLWHPGRNIGFGYTVTLLTWWDLVNTNGRKLQKEVVRCHQAQITIQEKTQTIQHTNNNETVQ